MIDIIYTINARNFLNLQYRSGIKMSVNTNETINDLILKYYEKFKTLPNGRPIVRENIQNDALPIVALLILYGDELELDAETVKITDIEKYIVAPPDNGIDIVVEREDSDEFTYNFIQVKNSPMSQIDVENAISYMKKTVSTYLKNPTKVPSMNLKKVLGSTNFDAAYKNNCTYTVVCNGDRVYANLKNNERVLTVDTLLMLKKCKENEGMKVPEKVFMADSFHNHMYYEKVNNDDEVAMMCNLRGYDLAELALDYNNTDLGRNYLFGQNLREGLVKSKTYDGMKKTIDNNPEKFWFYNNGITIIAEDYDAFGKTPVDKFVIKNFSIINGAQTTSALGKYLNEARCNRLGQAEENLKKVYVSARILKVKNQEFAQKIAVFNNTQNPITTRDMVSNNPEQIELNDWLKKGDAPNIYVEIRRGTQVPYSIMFQKHQKTTNTDLAQLVFAGFLQKPFSAKDKKTSLFDSDYKQNEFMVNESYHKIFHWTACRETQNEGIIFSKTKKEINELLFIQYLYGKARKILDTHYKEKIAEQRNLLDKASDDMKDHHQGIISINELNKSICAICKFYLITMYYGYKMNFPSIDKDFDFDYNKFYANTDNYGDKLIESFSQLFLEQTIETIKNLFNNSGNLTTWIRSGKSEQLFLKQMKEDLNAGTSKESLYKKFVKEFKISNI